MAPERKPVRWGILSTARINDDVLPQLQRLENAGLVAVASRDADKASAYASRHGIPRSYGSYEALLEDPDIDCVYISLPNHLHVPMSAAAFAAGKHVLCEKPLAPSREEGEWLFEQARKNGRLLMEAFAYRHHDKTLKLRELVRGGSLGDLLLIRSAFHFSAADPVGDIRFQPEMAGGALRDVGCYCTSLSTFLVGDAPTSLGASARLAPGGVDDVFAGVMSFEGGTTALFDVSMRSELYVDAMLVGTEGWAHVAMPWYPHMAPMNIEVCEGKDRRVIETSDTNGYFLEVENFSKAVLGEEETAVSADETLRNLGLMDDLAVAAQLPNYRLEQKGRVTS